MQSLNDIFQFAQNNATAFAATGVIGVSMWSRIKELPGRAFDFIKSRVLYTVDIKNNTLVYDHIEDILREKAINSRYTSFVIDSAQRGHNIRSTGTEVMPGVWKDKLGNYSNVYDKINIDTGTFLILYNGCIFIVSKSSEKRNVKNTDTKEFTITLTAITFSRSKALSIIHDYFNELAKPNKKTHLYKNHTNGTWNHAAVTEKRGLDTVFYNSGVIENLIQKIKEFKDNKDEYHRLSIPHKLIVCLEGPPGTGKTSLFLALAAHFDVSANFLNMSNVLDDSQFLGLTDNSNAFTLIDDIDADAVNINHRAGMHHQEQSQKSLQDNIDAPTPQSVSSERSFSYITLKDILQVLDGHFCPPGTIIFITTNRFDTLDEAITRRCDVVSHIGYVNQETQIKMAEFYGTKWGGSKKNVQPSKLSNLLRQKASTEELDKAFN